MSRLTDITGLPSIHLDKPEGQEKLKAIARLTPAMVKLSEGDAAGFFEHLPLELSALVLEAARAMQASSRAIWTEANAPTGDDSGDDGATRAVMTEGGSSVGPTPRKPGAR